MNESMMLVVGGCLSTDVGLIKNPADFYLNKAAFVFDALQIA